MATQSSLFDTPPSPVLFAASDWVTGTLFGSLASGLCVVAVAFVGLRLMMGHLPIRDGFRIIVGCFVLLGAPFIALGLQGAARQPGAPLQSAGSRNVLPEVPTPSYDPYLGASIKWDGFQAPRQQSPELTPPK